MCIRFLVSLLLLIPVRPSAQTVLLDEDFNGCALPASWQVRLMGDNLSPQWYVGLAQNPSILGQSIDNSCFLFIDDDAGGATAPGYMLEFVSPSFDVVPYTTVLCSMDVYFRSGASDIMQIFSSDGTTETLLARFDTYTTNYEPLDKGDYFKFRQDLVFVSQSPQTHLIIRYSSPNGSKGKFAGIDNIRVLGSGAGTNVLLEDFDNCQKPAGWTTEVVSGQEDWSFGFVPLGSSAFYEGNSMNGTCFALFDDNEQGDSAPPSTIRLRSPWFSGTEFFQYELSYDAIMRYAGFESFAVFLENEKNETILLSKTDGHVAGPFFPDYGSFVFDLSPYRSEQLRIVFEYADGGKQGYWTGIDNVKVTGIGPALDFCDNAQPLLTAAPCTSASNANALFDGPPATCSNQEVGSLWFRWQADFSGIAKLSTRADFNDVVNVFTGACNALQPVLCDNRDEHGFRGETTYFPCQVGTTYFLRVSGQEGGFGLSRGSVCIGIELAGTYPERPVNDDCATAHVLAVDNPCSQGNNRNAAMSPFQPSHNRLARADVWYQFSAPNLAPGQTLELEANADFSHILTLYQGTCAGLTEIATNPHGGSLTMPTLTAGQTYFVQAAGVFATVEGNLCPKIYIGQTPVPANDLCATATPVSLNAACLQAGNLGATFSGIKPGCAVSVDRDVWFQFTAPEFGSVQVNTGARFEHTLAVWEGDCNDLRPVFCAVNPLPCDGYTTIPNLNKNQTYFLQIASWNGAAGSGAGDICLKIRDGALPSDYEPLDITATQLCVGLDSVKLIAAVSGGTPPYSFLTDTAGQIVSGGTPWSLIVQDAVGCQTYQADTAKTCLSTACTANIEITPTPPSCFGASDGVLSAAVLSGGTGPFFFEWSNQIYTAGNANLAPGTYTLTISETTGCTYTLQAVLGDHDSLQIEISHTLPSCFGKTDGALGAVVTNGGIGPLAFEWSNQVFSADNTNLPAGTYSLTITESTGCTHTLETELEQPDSLFIQLESIQHPVQGASDGSIHVTLAGGTPPIMYSWYLNNNVFVAAAEDLEGVPGGTYILYAMDSNGCWDSLSRTLTETVGTRLIGEEPFAVRVFPNPATERVSVAVSLTNPVALDLSLRDVLGRNIQEQHAQAAVTMQFELDVQDLPPGVYLLHLQAGGRGVVRRLVVGR